MRKKSSNLSGGYSGKMKIRILFAKSAINALTERAEDQGSAIYNRAKNEDLEKQIKAMERTMEGLKEELRESKERNRDWRARIRFKERIGSMSVSFEDKEKRKDEKEDPRKKTCERRVINEHIAILKYNTI